MRTVSSKADRDRASAATMVARLATEPQPIFSGRSCTVVVLPLESEVMAHYQSGPLEIIASHTYKHATESLPDGTGRRTVPLDPRNRVGIDGIWEDEDWGRVGAEFTYIGPQRLEEDPYHTWSPAYVLVNFLAEVRLGRQRLFLVARNLGDVRQTGWDPLLLPVRAPDGRWTAPLEGRVVSAGVRVEF